MGALRRGAGVLHATHPASSAASESTPLHAALSSRYTPFNPTALHSQYYLCLHLQISLFASAIPFPRSTPPFFLLWDPPELFPTIGSLQMLPYLVASSGLLQTRWFATLSTYQNNLKLYH